MSGYVTTGLSARESGLLMPPGASGILCIYALCLQIVGLLAAFGESLPLLLTPNSLNSERSPAGVFGVFMSLTLPRPESV